MSELTKVATMQELPAGSTKQVDVGGAAVALFNVDGRIYATGGACTHQGGPLGEGDLEGNVVTCPWHGAEFDVTTGNVMGPPAGRSIPTYKVVVEGDDIKLEVPATAS